LPSDGYLFDAKVTPNGKFLYVLNNESDGKSAKAVWEYSINSSTGMLSPIVAPGTPLVVAGSGATAVTIDPTSRFAYVVNRTSNSVSMYTIDQNTGALTLNMTPNAPLGVLLSAGAPVPFRIAFDPSGKFVYVTNQNFAVAIYTVASDGTLVNAGTTGHIGALSTAIAPHQ
jgi:6-phosphogluconolactonase